MLIRKAKTNIQGSLSVQAWKRFRRNPAAMAGLIWICLSVIVSISGYLITPDSTPFANRQHLEIATKKPGFSIDMLSIRINAEKPKHTIWKKLTQGIQPIYKHIPVQSWSFTNDTLYYEIYSGQEGYPGLQASIPVWDVLYAIDLDEAPIPVDRKKTGVGIYSQHQHVTYDSLSIMDINGEVHFRSVKDMQEEVEKNQLNRKKFLLGTDRFGRDMLSQLIIGMRVSLAVGFIAVFISLVIGITLGSIAGYYRGHADNVIVWLINVVWSIPTLLLVIAITFAIGKGFWQVFLAVGLTMWVEVARLVRGQTISVREKEYVEAARALGLSNLRIISKHILPNIIGPVIVISAANFASAILIEAGLSFLGIGVQPPMPSWGTMIRDHYGFIILNKGFLAFLPGIMIMLMVMAFMLAGNGLKEALDKTSAA